METSDGNIRVLERLVECCEGNVHDFCNFVYQVE